MLYPAKGRSRISCTEIPLPDVEFYTAEKFGASFALVRSDLGGNIDRLETARRKNISKYASLYPIILDEINRKEQGEKYSDSKALLWLKRFAPHLASKNRLCHHHALLYSHLTFLAQTHSCLLTKVWLSANGWQCDGSSACLTCKAAIAVIQKHKTALQSYFIDCSCFSGHWIS